MIFAVIVGAIILVLVSAGFVRMRETMHRAEGDCRSLLEIWMEENRLTLLRYRRTWFFHTDSANHLLVVYRVIVVDRERRMRTGRASIIGRMTGPLEFTPSRIEVRWGRVRATAQPVRPSARPESDPLWDRWIDA